MAHNIGQMFYFGERPWHRLGEELKAPATLEQALAAGGLDWEVTLQPIVPAGEPESRIGHRVAVVRTDKKPGETGRVVGVVHPGFEPLQNRQGAHMFDTLMGKGKAIYHTGGYLRNGEVIWLLARLPSDIRVRGDDILETYLLFTNSHDGSVAIDIRLTTVRVVCQNTLSLALHQHDMLGKVFRRAHHGSYALLQEDARTFFDFSMRHSRETGNLFTRMANKPCTDREFQDFLNQLMPDPGKPASADRNPAVQHAYETRMESLRANRKQIVGVHREGIPERNIPPAEADWWGALNTITAWSDHLQTTESERYAHLLLGRGDKLKASAFARIQATTGIRYADAR